MGTSGRSSFAGVELDEVTSTVGYRNEQGRDVAGVVARVESFGDIDRRVTTTRLLLTGPLALGLRKKRDHRIVFLTIEGEDFAWAVEVSPKQYGMAQNFAATVNSAARRHSGATTSTGLDRTTGEHLKPVDPTQQGVGGLPHYISELRDLAALHQSGLLTNQEFEDQKRRLLP